MKREKNEIKLHKDIIWDCSRWTLFDSEKWTNLHCRENVKPCGWHYSRIVLRQPAIWILTCNTNICFSTTVTLRCELKGKHTKKENHTEQERVTCAFIEWRVCEQEKEKQQRRRPPPWRWKARKAWRRSRWECSEILFEQPEGAVAPGSSSGPSVKTCLARGRGTCEL